MPKRISVWIEKDGRVRYRNAKGKAQTEGTYKSANDAKTARDNLIARLRLKRLGECDPSLLLLTAWEKYVKDLRLGFANKKGLKLRESSISTITFHVRPLLDRAKVISDLEEDTDGSCRLVSEMLSELVDEGLGDWSIYGIRKDCAAFCHYLQRRNILDFDPFKNLVVGRPESRPRYYTDDELEALEEAAQGKTIHAWLRMGYLAGLRYSEILNATWENVRIHENGTGELSIWGYQSKNRRPRTVPLCREIIELLGTRREGPLFPGWTRGTFCYQWAKLKCDANIVEPSIRYHRKYSWAQKEVNEEEGARFHDLRHTFCKLYLQNGGRPEKLQKITGHKSLQVLMDVYGHFETGHLFADVESIFSRPKFLGQKRGKLDIIGINPGQTQSQPDTESIEPKNEKAVEN